MKRFVCFVALFCALVGCGGGGGGTGDVIDQWVSQMTNAIRNENISAMDALISSSYLDDCENESQYLGPWASFFADASNISITEVNFANKIILSDTAFANGTYKLNFTGPGGSASITVVADLYLQKEGTVWREIGNQQCSP